MNAGSRAQAKGPSAVPYGVLVLLSLAGSGAFAADGLASWNAARGPSPPGDPLGDAALAAMLLVVWAARSVGLFYLLGFAAKAAAYVAWGPRRPSRAVAQPDASSPGLAVLSLTADDFDPPAVRSLLHLEWPGPRLFVLHDDGVDDARRAVMERELRSLPESAGWQIRVLHRPRREGGKAGAVNWVVERLEPEWKLLLLCDSDSTALDPTTLVDSAGAFSDPRVAVIQYRNAGVWDEGDGPFLRRLAWAIDAFDAFASPQSRFGYLPFFGHNALLRVDELHRLGGLTPGFFSDDLDFSIRLTLDGRRILYRADRAFGERHPPDLVAFRKRARKWAFGCMQVVKARLGDVLTRRGVPFAHRVGMVEFMMFYPAQALLLAGVTVELLLLPWFAPRLPGSPLAGVPGGAVVLALLAPTAAWSWRAGTLRQWPFLAWSCVLVYGGSLADTARGVLDGLSHRTRPWISTNLANTSPAIPARAWIDSLFGLALVAVPWAYEGGAIASPTTYLFSATFLFSPLLHLVYRRSPEAPEAIAGAPGLPGPPRAREAAAGITRVMLATAWITACLLAGPAQAQRQAMPEDGPRLTIDGERLRLDGRPFMVRGVHYSPWLPGTGPDGRSAYPGPETTGPDLEAISELGANTILVHQAPRQLVAMAAERGLVVIQVFSISWHDTSAAAFERQADEIVATIDTLRAEPGYVAWILGHEVPSWVVDLVGAGRLEERLAGLARRVREVDDRRPLGHANWPPTRELDPPGFDLACFNLYPAWPYEVSVRGFGPYLRDELVPRAGGRPLIVTEFGINALEASEARQAAVLAECWREIVESRIAGGVAFSFSDEWWKNFDNPIPGRGYWERAHDPEDASRHDEDPEEYYGLVRTDRTRRPAYAALQQGFGADPPRDDRPLWPWAVLAVLGFGTWVMLRPGRLRREKPRAGSAKPVKSAPGPLLLLVGATILATAGSPRGIGPAQAAFTRVDSLTGAAADDQFGWTVAGVGDLDGDGLGEIAVGARFANVGGDTAAGVTYLYRGHASGAPVLLAALFGVSDHEHFGESIAGGSDIDGDGIPDVVVGAPLRSGPGGSGAGALDVYRGGAIIGSSPLFSLHGENADDWFGQSVAIGDLDADGVAEIAVGAPFNDRGGNAAGAVFLYRSSAPQTPFLVLQGSSSNEHFGWSVACPGDLDGDGYGDVVVGARLYGTGPGRARGRVVLFHGGPAMDATADGEWLGLAADDWFGNSIAAPGDVDGGGRPDLLVGAPYAEGGGLNSGAAYLFRGEDPPGSPAARVYPGERGDDQLGWAVGAAGDVDGDGFPDLALGARMHDGPARSAAGRLSLLPGGPALSTSPLANADGEAANDWLGHSAGGGIAYFAAGLGTALAGAPFNDRAGSAAGRAYVLAIQSNVGVDPAPGREAGWIVHPNPGVEWVRLRNGAGEPSGEPLLFRIADARGRLVRELRGASGDAGGEVVWNLRDHAGRRVPPGVYFTSVVNPGRAASQGSEGTAVRIVVLAP